MSVTNIGFAHTHTKYDPVEGTELNYYTTTDIKNRNNRITETSEISSALDVFLVNISSSLFF